MTVADLQSCGARKKIFELLTSDSNAEERNPGRGYRFMNQRYGETKEILKRAGYELDKDLDKDMDAALWEGSIICSSACRRMGSVNEAGLRLVIDEEKAAGKLPAEFSMQAILNDRFVKAAAQSVNQRFGSGLRIVSESASFPSCTFRRNRAVSARASTTSPARWAFSPELPRPLHPRFSA